jgi:predicted unusual protein kinase regulating ubiquinone biosynthesis (AarF/ABC1/UbiB family)
MPEPRAITRAWRFCSVVWLAARIYTGYKAIQLWSRHISDQHTDARYRRQDLRAARAMYRASLRLEGLLIKMSQFIATRADVLPDEWVATLESLHDRVPPRPFEIIRAQVKREMGRPLGSIFSEFDPQPLAAASLAQVHQARTFDGRRCAVKVQYPGIEGIIRADLRNLMFTLRMLAWLEPGFDFQVIMRELLKYLPMELDFLNEAQNCDTLRRNLAVRNDVVVPHVYHELTTRRVLTKVTDLDGLARASMRSRKSSSRFSPSRSCVTASSTPTLIRAISSSARARASCCSTSASPRISRRRFATRWSG